MENTTCETFTLTVAPGDYTGKRIVVRIGWLLPTTDYDMYIHEGSASGPLVASSGQGTTTFEQTTLSIDPPIVPTAKVYAIHIVAFAVPPLQNYAGRVTVATAPPPRMAIYLPSSITFSPNITVAAPYAVSDGEPSVRCDVRGNYYVAGIQGVPAGCDMWRFDLNQTSPTFDPGLQNPTYLGQPDAFLPLDRGDKSVGGADGGGDVDMAVSFPTSPTTTPVLTMTSLAAANISSAVSTDRGEHFTLSPATAIVPSDDRMWNEADGDNTVYMVYRAPVPATGLFCARSTDNGFTFLLTGVVSPTGTVPGYIDVDHGSGTVYVSHTTSSSLLVARSTNGGLTWKDATVDNSTQHGQLFDVVKVGNDGTVYAVWSDGQNIYLAHSTDHGVTWSDKVRVNDNSVYKTNLFAWMEAGDAGRVDIVWYGTTSPSNTDAADWVVLFAQSTNATAPTPTFPQKVISDHVIHGSNISTGGLTGTDNRNLLDYFQVALDPQGAAVLAYTDDHNDYYGNVYVTRQLDGTSLYANANGTGQVISGIVTPPPPPDPTVPEVQDFLHDAVTALIEPIPTDSPFDILSVDYSCTQDTVASKLYLVATMKVSTLSPLPVGVNWRMSFTANAPGGVSDRGDQFYVQANSDNPLIPVYTYGTAVRGSDGSITYTSRGNADYGAIGVNDNTITIRVDVAKLNPYVTHGPAIGPGSVLYGLRGQTFTTGVAGASDRTRGGTSYTIACGVTAVGDEQAGGTTRHALYLRRPSPNPATRTSSVTFGVEKAGFVELSVFDISGRRVRTIQAGTLAPGEYTRTWDGRTDRFTDAPAGVYVFTLSTPSGIRSERVALTR
jgi:hypothetical protein